MQLHVSSIVTPLTLPVTLSKLEVCQAQIVSSSRQPSAQGRMCSRAGGPAHFRPTQVRERPSAWFHAQAAFLHAKLSCYPFAGVGAVGVLNSQELKDLLTLMLGY